MSLKRDRSVGDVPNNTEELVRIDQKRARRSGKNKDKKQQNSLPLSQSIDDTITAVLSNNTEQNSSTTQTDHDDLNNTAQAQLESMRRELKQLLETVSSLSSKIDHLSCLLQAPDASRTNITKSQDVTVAANDATSDHIPSNPYRSNDRKIRPNHQAGHKDDPVTAMYIDLNLRNQRANNIVISGMPPSQSEDLEKKAVIDMLRFEYDWDAELWPGISIIKCRRLGEPQDGKCQPLLVTLDSREQAEFYIKHAKQLRNSSRPEIRQCVFINADLTPSESRAAYELRLRRRERMHQQKSDQGRQSGATSFAASRTFYHSRESERDLDVGSSITVPRDSALPSTVHHLINSSALSVSPGQVVQNANVSKAAPLSPTDSKSRQQPSPTSLLTEPRLVWRTSSVHDEQAVSTDAVLMPSSSGPVIIANNYPVPATVNDTEVLPASSGRQCQLD